VAFGLIAGLAGFALQGASALASHGAQKRAARQNRASAFAAWKLNRADLQARENQATEAANLDIFGLNQQGAAAVSTAAASAGESGVAGNSVTALINTYLADTSRATQVVERNLGITTEELDRRQQSSYMEYKDRLNAVPSPSGLNLGLNLAGAALKAAPQILPYFRGSGTGLSALDQIGEMKPVEKLIPTRVY
jgi:hypothetical protein